MPLVPHTPPRESNYPRLGLRCPPPTPLPFSSASGGTSLPRQTGHVTNTKAYGWAVSAVRHVVLLGVGGQARGERAVAVGDGQQPVRGDKGS